MAQVYSIFGINNKTFKCSNNLDDEGSSYPSQCVGGDDRGRISVKPILDNYDISKVSPQTCILALAIYIVVTRYSAYFILNRRMKKHISAGLKLDMNEKEDTRVNGQEEKEAEVAVDNDSQV